MAETVIERDSAVGAAGVGSKQSRRRMTLSALALLGAVAGAWYGQQWWTVGRWLETTDDAYVGGDVTSISPRVAGFVAEVAVRDNQHVAAGEILVRLDDRDLRTALDHADAIVRQREAILGSLQAKLVLQQSAIRQAEADLAAKAAEARFAQQDARRYRDLVATRVGSQQNAQRAVAVSRQADAAVLAAQAAREAAEQQLTVLDTGIDEANAAVAEAKADRRAAELRLGYAEIRSPIDGYVGNRSVRVGAYVSEGAYLLTVVPAHELWIDANFKEDQLARIAAGQPATVVADIMPERALHARVVSVAAATGSVFSIIPAENATGNFTKIVQRVPVRLVIDAGEAVADRLRPGLSTTVTIDTRTD